MMAYSSIFHTMSVAGLAGLLTGPNTGEFALVEQTILDSVTALSTLHSFIVLPCDTCKLFIRKTLLESGNHLRPAMGSKTVEVTIIDMSLSQKIIIHSVPNADNLQLEYLCKTYMGTPNHLRYIIYQVRSAL